jgi:fatty acid desaturase
MVCVRSVPPPKPAAPRRDVTAVLINDRRDRPFLVLMVLISLTVVPWGVAFYIPGVFSWLLGLAYLSFIPVFFLDRFILMLHNTSHRPLFKKPWGFMNNYIPWVLGPFFGQTPETYFAHHIGMHHPENNLEADLSSTMPYRRDNLLHFLLYYLRFMATGLPELTKYLTTRDRKKIRTRMLLGEIGWLLAVAALLYVNWRATIVVLIFPVVIVRFLMMAGNWGQHAFIDPRTPEVAYRNSIVVLDKRYNSRCFNDGYHIGHHIKATRHWTEMPEDFEANRATYAREGAIVFRDVGYFGVWWRLMTHQYHSLARHYVVLEGERPSEEKIIALLRERAQLIPRRSEVLAAA